MTAIGMLDVLPKCLTIQCEIYEKFRFMYAVYQQSLWMCEWPGNHVPTSNRGASSLRVSLAQASAKECSGSSGMAPRPWLPVVRCPPTTSTGYSAHSVTSSKACAEASTALPNDTIATPPAYTDNAVTPTITSTDDIVATPYAHAKGGVPSQFPLASWFPWQGVYGSCLIKLYTTVELLTLFQVTFKKQSIKCLFILSHLI